MEVKSVSQRPCLYGQSLRDREVLCLTKGHKKIDKKRPKTNAVNFLKKTCGADELITNKKVKSKNKDLINKFIKNGENEADEANQKRIIASGILACMVFASGYLICKRGA